ncbi:hypothetical protein [Streptomyces wuyuanensis]|uniref:Uncharacterized protein n=1 Tax=Streptomyces wuyuanensis TaxID=1196353 RepID=A0A1H0DXT9_9ACTN|nr:hypothetical protein [Streptomyces wuyuanensis]SDN74811.1 hypothetical protein SAMN05444921_13719 [Streptomyces wuyuanensis]
MTRNITHQQRIARDLNAAVGCGYQEALRRVRQAAAAGCLPTPPSTPRGEQRPSTS